MPRYDGRGNLIPVNERTKDEQREITAKGGVKSGAARRKKRDFRRLANEVCALKPQLTRQALESLQQMGCADEAPDVATMAMISLAANAMKGDLAALAALFDYAGALTGKQQIEMQRLELEKKRLELETAGDTSGQQALDEARRLLGGLDSAIR